MSTYEHDTPSDIKIAQLERRIRDIKSLFFGIILMILGYLFFWQLFSSQTGKNIPCWITARFVEIMGILLSTYLILHTKIKLEDLKIITTKKYLLFDLLKSALITLSVLLLLICIKVFFYINGIPIAPNNKFWDWSITGTTQYTYIFVVPIQEFTCRCVTQNYIKKCFSSQNNKFSSFVSIFISSCIFAIFHTAYGSLFMLAAVILSMILGLIFEKQHSIWGCVLIHWFIGLSVDYLGFF